MTLYRLTGMAGGIVTVAYLEYRLKVHSLHGSIMVCGKSA